MKIVKLILNSKYRRKHLDFYRLKHSKRYVPKIVNVFEKPLKITDSASFLSQYKEIFISKLYKFKNQNINPYIIDGGSNIGLATIFWKKEFPEAEILCFEPDPMIYDALCYNVQSFDFKNITLINKGLWDTETEICFQSDGADAGQITNKTTSATIKTTTLSTFIKKRVDFLKLDIEGAEYNVLSECKLYLNNVQNLFIEYHSFAKKKQNLNEILNIISNAGFKYFIQNTGVVNTHPFLIKSIENGMDLQLNIFCYRP